MVLDEAEGWECLQSIPCLPSEFHRPLAYSAYLPPTPFIAGVPGLITGPLPFPPSAGLGAWGHTL